MPPTQMKAKHLNLSLPKILTKQSAIASRKKNKHSQTLKRKNRAYNPQRSRLGKLASMFHRVRTPPRSAVTLFPWLPSGERIQLTTVSLPSALFASILRLRHHHYDSGTADMRHLIKTNSARKPIRNVSKMTSPLFVNINPLGRTIWELRHSAWPEGPKYTTLCHNDDKTWTLQDTPQHH